MFLVNKIFFLNLMIMETHLMITSPFFHCFLEGVESPLSSGLNSGLMSNFSDLPSHASQILALIQFYFFNQFLGWFFFFEFCLMYVNKALTYTFIQEFFFYYYDIFLISMIFYGIEVNHYM